VSVVAGGVMIAGPSGIVAGAVGAVVVVMVPARGGAARLDPDQVPVVVDLVSGCLSAGSTLPDALDAAAVAGDEVLALACRSIAGSLRSGVPADVAWSDWLEDPWLGPVARTAVRTAHSGAAAAEDFRRTASRLRARRRAAAEHKVRQAAVWLVAPLGLCFLPAFVLLAVVPLVAGLLPSLR
jgi:Flp pilus assembly protein TadB